MADWARLRVGDLTRAALELGLARYRLARHRPTIEPAVSYLPQLDSNQSALVDRVAFVIPRVAARMPWRADCLVQALAAECWLASAGIATRLTLGVPRDKRPDFEAHAWLKAGDQIVTGGDISNYVPLVKS